MADRDEIVERWWICVYGWLWWNGRMLKTYLFMADRDDMSNIEEYLVMFVLKIVYMSSWKFARESLFEEINV